MVILQANKFFYEKGGSERYFFALCRALESRGHRVVPFAMRHPRNLPSDCDRYFVARRDYDAAGASPGSLGAALSFVRSPAAARSIRALVDDATPDVAHLHNIYHQLTPSIIDALADRGVPVVMTLHDYKLACPSYAMFAKGAYCFRCRGGRFEHALAVRCGGSLARSALLAFEAYWQRWTRVYDHVSCFIAPSQYLRGVMLEAGIAPERIVHVAPLNPATAPPGDASGSAPRGDDGLPPGFVAYIGRLSREKGVHVLLEAARLRPEIPVVIFGEGPENASLRELAGRHVSGVVFAGHASRAGIESALRRAVAVVMPTLSPENAPMAILEAADAGVPVIVSDRGGLPELATRVGGQVVPAGDVDALAVALQDAWHDASGRAARAREAWRLHRADHAADAHVTAIEAIYRRVMARTAA